MPKKHTPAYTATKPNYVHPSLQSSRATASSASAEPQSVNQRIAQLRREQAPRATIEQRNEMTSVVSSRTVPPDLRRILHLPEINAPKPKVGTRMRTRGVGGTRLPPGPAAPTSWLYASRFAPKRTQNFSTEESGERMSLRFGHLVRATQQDFKRLLPPPLSLQHTCLRTFAEHWIELSEFEQHYLPTLPVLMREALLSYLTLYGDDHCLTFKSFKTLFQTAEEEAQGWDDVQFLDLTGLLNEDFTLNDLNKCLKRVLLRPADDLETLSTSKTNARGKRKAAVEVADSWEEEADEVAEAVEALPAQLTLPYFSNLSRISLAHAGESAHWPDLLKISPHLNKITHLSLAYWPRPTLTPNSATASMVTQYARVALGGTSYYSDLDDDWHEAANILRRFSMNTYSLQWLDLEGCKWFKALTWCPENPQANATTPSLSPHAQDSWNISTTTPGPDWNDSWQRVTYLHLFQGWIPADNKSIQNMPAGVVPLQLMRWLREHQDDEMVTWKLNSREKGYGVTEWVEREKAARAVGAAIQASRRAKKGLWCKIDHGWGGDSVEKVS